MTPRVWLTPTAAKQAADVDAWWRENREKAPGLFEQELASALALLATAPASGARRRHRRIPGLRRLFLPGTRFHLYYVHDRQAEQVVVLAVWSAVRGRGPVLRGP